MYIYMRERGRETERVFVNAIIIHSLEGAQHNSIIILKFHVGRPTIFHPGTMIIKKITV